MNWALARRQGWSIVLRVEDLDGPRVKPGAAEQAVADLRWLGLDWDDGPITQRADLSPYRAALDALDRAGLLYPCTCSRREVAAAQSAPHGDEHELRYPGTCRRRGAAERVAGRGSRVGSGDTEALHADGPGVAWRVVVPDEDVAFVDDVAGPQVCNVQRHVGDFVVATREGLPAYQLAVVVDDARQGVTHVVRGDDLLPSTARQLLLHRMLGLDATAPPPRYAHLPLVLGPDGRRLAKRHGDTRLAWYRDRGVAPGRVVALLARWCGLPDAGGTMTSAQFAAAFDLPRLPRGPVTFTPEDHAWLLQP